MISVAPEIAEITLDTDHNLGAIRTIPQFRQLAEQAALTPAERETLLQQASVMIDTVYVHLLQKRAMYGIKPTQRLRLLRHASHN